MSKLTGRPSMFHKIAILFDLCINCHWRFFTQLPVSIGTVSHEQLYSVHTEAFSAPLPLLVPGGPCQMKSPKYHSRLTTSEQR